MILLYFNFIITVIVRAQSVHIRKIRMVVYTYIVPSGVTYRKNRTHMNICKRKPRLLYTCALTDIGDCPNTVTHLMRYTDNAKMDDLCRLNDKDIQNTLCPHNCTKTNAAPWCYYKTPTNPCRVPHENRKWYPDRLNN